MCQLPFHAKGDMTPPPPLQQLEKATIAHHSSKLIITSWAPCIIPQQGVDPCQQLQNAEFSRQWALDVHLSGAQHELIKELSQGYGCGKQQLF